MVESGFGDVPWDSILLRCMLLPGRQWRFNLRNTESSLSGRRVSGAVFALGKCSLFSALGVLSITLQTLDCATINVIPGPPVRGRIRVKTNSSEGAWESENKLLSYCQEHAHRSLSYMHLSCWHWVLYHSTHTVNSGNIRNPVAITCGLVYRPTTFLMWGIRVNSSLPTAEKVCPHLPWKKVLM